MKKKLFIVIAILFFLIIPIYSITYSQTEQPIENKNVSIFPIFEDIVYKEPYSGKFNLKNTTDTKMFVKVKLGLLENNQATLTTKSESIHKFIRLEPENNFDIESNTQKEIKYTVSLDSSVSAGNYKPIFIFEFYSSDTGKLEFRQQLPFVINLTVGNNSTKNYTSSLYSSNYIFLKPDFLFKVKIQNISTTYYIKPQVRFQIADNKSNIIYQEVINESLSEIGAGKNLYNEINLNESRIKNIGIYRAQIAVYDSTNNYTDFQQIDFIYLPYWFIILVVIVVLFLLTALITYIFKNKLKK